MMQHQTYNGMNQQPVNQMYQQVPNMYMNNQNMVNNMQMQQSMFPNVSNNTSTDVL